MEHHFNLQDKDGRKYAEVILMQTINGFMLGLDDFRSETTYKAVSNDRIFELFGKQKEPIT